MSAGTLQMNVRIPADIKRSGDDALAGIGLTPSVVVRALWEKASRRGKDLAEVASLLATQKAEALSADDPALDGASIVNAAMAKLGYQLGEAAVPALSDSDLMELALADRLAERNLDE